MELAIKENPVSHERADKLRSQLVELQQQKKITYQSLAEKSGLSRSYISEFVSGKKNLNNDLLAELEGIIKGFIASDETTHTETIPFYLTTDARETITVLEDCRESNLWGVIAGAAGLGKTTTINRYLQMRDNVSFYTPRSSVSLKSFLKELSKLFGVVLASNNTNDMTNEVIRFLTLNPKFIIIDEFGRIIRNGNMRIMEAIRDIRDACGRNLGIVLSGHSEDFAELLRCGKGQIISRLGPVYELQGPTQVEAAQIVEPLWMTPEAKKEMAHLITTFARRDGIRGILEELYQKSVRMAGNGIISLDILKDAGRRTVYGFRANRI